VGRLKAKTFEVKREEKGSPLQTKINAFTKGKNITAVHDFDVVVVDQDDDVFLRATLLYTEGAEGEDYADRLLSKVIDNVPQDSELQTKVNAFTKGKELDVQGTAIASDGRTATVVLLYVRLDEGGDDEASETAAEEAPVEEAPAAEEPAAEAV
jgi:hypothetical protein